jgi:hypothetical protein
MHSIRQHILDVRHRIGYIQSRSQQAGNVVFGQASLLRRFLQPLYRKKDGYSVPVLHEFKPPFAQLCG